MDFQYESLQSCSMVIRKATHQDEGCYRCLFNTYPKGALIGWTCLKLYELHGPFINVSRSNSPPGSVVTCSATGRSVPIVTLTVLHQNLSFSQYNTSRETNTNGTVTFTTTALLSALNTTQVECSVSVQTDALRELLVIVPGLTDLSDDEDFESDDKDVGRPVAVAVGLLVFLSGTLGILSMLWVIKTHQNRMKKNPTEQTRNNQSEEYPIPEKDEKQPVFLINRQSSKQQSPTTPTIPDIESCPPEGMKLHQKLIAKKSN